MQGKCFATGSDFLFFGVVIMEKVGVYTSLREGGGLGRSPKTEGASGRKTGLTVRDGTSPSLSYFGNLHGKVRMGYR